MFIYKLTSPSGKSYIGKTNNINRRLYEHEYNARNNIKGVLYDSIRKYSYSNFKVEILEDSLNIFEIDTVEKYYISLYCTYKNGYNSTKGGDGGSTRKGHKSSEEHKRKMSASQLGKPKSLETRERMKQPKSEAHKRKISNIVSDTRWVSNLLIKETKKINKSDLSYYLNNGWINERLWSKTGKVLAPKRLKQLEITDAN